VDRLRGESPGEGEDILGSQCGTLRAHQTGYVIVEVPLP
jgi:hypothetical protein